MKTTAKILVAGLLAFSACAQAQNFRDPINTVPTLTATTALKLGSSSDLYLSRYAAKQVMISGDGIGATTNAGWIDGYSGISGYANRWVSTVTPSSSNYALQAGATITTLNSTSSTRLSISDSIVANATSTGLAVTGTLSATGTITGDGLIDGLTVRGGSRAVIGDMGVGAAVLYHSGVATVADGYVAIQSNGSVQVSAKTGQEVGLRINNVDVAAVSATGLAVTGTLSATPTLSASSGTENGMYVPVTVTQSGTASYNGLWVDVSVGSAGSGAKNLFKLTSGGGTDILVATTTALTLGTGVNLVTANDVIMGKTITAPATTGAQTINKTTGRVNFAAAATSLVVTNSLVTANSIIHCTVATNDATMFAAQCVPGSGSFTIYGNAAATAETAVAFTVTN